MLYYRIPFLQYINKYKIFVQCIWSNIVVFWHNFNWFVLSGVAIPKTVLICHHNHVMNTRHKDQNTLSMWWTLCEKTNVCLWIYLHACVHMRLCTHTYVCVWQLILYACTELSLKRRSYKHDNVQIELEISYTNLQQNV